MSRTDQAPELQQLDLLVGDWALQAVIDGNNVGAGATSFRWMEHHQFLVQRSSEESGSDAQSSDWAKSAPDTVTMVIGYDDTNEGYAALYVDSRGVHRIYHMALHGGNWQLWRNAPGFSQRFTGTFSEDGNVIHGRWETAEDGENWQFDFDLIYTRTSE